MPDAEHYEIPASVLDALNPTEKRPVVDRRGSTVWDVEAERGRYAVKLGYPITATSEWEAQEWTALAPAREGAVLQQIGTEEITYGEWDQGTWNAQPWREGISLYELWEPHRSRKATSDPDLGDALSCAETLAALHAKGWVHGDIQPAHFIVGPTGTFLIDLALAQGGEIPASYDFHYRGCLVHYESPEISRSVLGSGTAIPARAADVYALGATLFISATGFRHVAYPDDATRKVQRQAIVDGPHRPVNVPGVLGKLIETMLSPEPNDRPTSAEVCAVLRNAR